MYQGAGIKMKKWSQQKAALRLRMKGSGEQVRVSLLPQDPCDSKETQLQLEAVA